MSNLFLVMTATSQIVLMTSKSPVIAPDHSQCGVTNWTEFDHAIRFSNALLSASGTILNWFQSALDPIDIPTPITIQLKPHILGADFYFNIVVSSLRLHGLSELSLIPLYPVGPVTLETGLTAESMYVEFMLDMTFGKTTTRRFGLKYCPGLKFPFTACAVNTGVLKLMVNIKEADMRLTTDLWVYDCNARNNANFIDRTACKIKSSWLYLWATVKDGFTQGAGRRALNRIHDAHVRYSSVSFRQFDLDIQFESELAATILDPEIFGFLRTQLDAEFREGVFHDSVCSSLANAVRNAANKAIASMRPMFNSKHITE